MVDLRTIEVPAEVLNLIPKQTAVDLSVVPLRIESDGVVIAMKEEADSSLLSDLMFLLGKRVKTEIVPEADLTDAIRRLYGVSDLEMSRSTTSNSHVISVRDEEQRVELSSDGSVVDLANRIISDAVRMGASTLSRMNANFVSATASTESCTKFSTHRWKNRSRLCLV